VSFIMSMIVYSSRLNLFGTSAFLPTASAPTISSKTDNLLEYSATLPTKLAKQCK
jgi:hypothetical protein